MKNNLAFFVLSLSLMSMAGVTPAQLKKGAADSLLGAALHQEEVEGRLLDAIATYKKVLAARDVTRALAARAWLRIGICYDRLGNLEARAAYETVLRNFADQKEILQEAQRRLSTLNGLDQTRPRAGPGMRRVLVENDEVRVPLSPSPDGRSLAFVEKGMIDLGIVDLASGATRRITRLVPQGENRESANGAIWAPGGDRIAYILSRRGEEFDELRMISLSDSTSRMIYKGPAGEMALGTWSADGTSILILECNYFALVSVKDGSKKILATIDGVAHLDSFGLSPDGRHLAFSFKGPGKTEYDIDLIPVAKGTQVPLIRHKADDHFIGWAPDGKDLLFSSDRNGTIDAWRISVVATGPEGEPFLLMSNLGPGSALGVTRSGTVFYSRRSVVQDIFVSEIDLAAGRLLTKPARIHPFSGGQNASPAWSRDGRFLAYLCGRSSALEVDALCVWGLADGSHRQLRLSSPIAAGSTLYWSADEAEIEAQGIKLANGVPVDVGCKIDGRTGRVLDRRETPPVPRGRRSPDGKTALQYWIDPSTNIVSFSIRSLLDTKVAELYKTDAPSGILMPFQGFSPDGRWVVLPLFRRVPNQPATRTIIVASTAGEGAREVFRFDEKYRLQLLAWTADSRQILCLVSMIRDAGAMEWWMGSVEGGAPRRLDFSIGKPNILAFSPDTKHLAYSSTVIGPEEVWAMENLLSPVPKPDTLNGKKSLK